MPDTPYRYTSEDEDSARWTGFPFRDGDIVISTRSKSGTTWTQMICALLVFGSSKLPAALSDLSPWLDMTTEPRADVYALLEAQQHRRFIKTHTPLDGVPLDSRATYIVVARHPLDMAVSLYHQSNNINRQRLHELLGTPAPTAPEPPPRPVREWLLSWASATSDPRTAMDSLSGVMWHLSDAWARRDQPNIVLLHYDDLSADLEAEMRKLAERLGIQIADEVWPELVHAATFDQMRSNVHDLVPDRKGVFKDKAAFFRRGRSGSGRELLTEDELATYRAHVATMGPADLVAWLHHD